MDGRRYEAHERVARPSGLCRVFKTLQQAGYWGTLLDGSTDVVVTYAVFHQRQASCIKGASCSPIHSQGELALPLHTQGALPIKLALPLNGPRSVDLTRMIFPFQKF
jgi:hypothetical protein